MYSHGRINYFWSPRCQAWHHDWWALPESRGAEDCFPVSRSSRDVFVNKDGNVSTRFIYKWSLVVHKVVSAINLGETTYICALETCIASHLPIHKCYHSWGKIRNFALRPHKVGRVGDVVSDCLKTGKQGPENPDSIWYQERCVFLLELKVTYSEHSRTKTLLSPNPGDTPTYWT